MWQMLPAQRFKDAPIYSITATITNSLEYIVVISLQSNLSFNCYMMKFRTVHYSWVRVEILISDTATPTPEIYFRAVLSHFLLETLENEFRLFFNIGVAKNKCPHRLHVKYRNPLEDLRPCQ